MSSIDEHVAHDGKGKTRTTRCRHCSKLFTSRSKDRWRQHMRSCNSLPPELRQFFLGNERKPYARPSVTFAEIVSELRPSPAPSSEPESAPSSPVSSTAAVSSGNSAVADAGTCAGSSASIPPPENSLLRAVDLDAESATISAAEFLTRTSDKITEILLIHGPCSFVRSVWTGGDIITKPDLLREVHNLAVEEGISLVTHESNHEGTIDWMLNAKENEVIVLCWVARLSDSPTILRALALIKNRVIVVSPRGVDHGDLPTNVVGVLSGFGQLSFSLALAAAKNLNAQQEGKT